jgi:hypothetical protein
MSTQFLVVAGGTGSRIAEAYVHLCAAGLGPDKVHVLVIDADSTNGNLERFRKTLSAYEACRQLDWKFPEALGRGFFGTDIKSYELTEKLQVLAHGIEGLDCTPAECRDVLNLFYTENEQKFNGDRGFLARPNLGSLVIGKHISDALADQDRDAGRFIRELRTAMNANDTISFVTCGSIFGGTGASVMPVITAAVRESLSRAANNVTAAEALKAQWERVPRSAVMMLPYFQPRDPGPEQPAETVDPSRFLSDAKNSLKFYQQTGSWKGFERIYLIGSDKPSRHQPVFCSGARDQANAPFLEELLGALAAIDSVGPRQPDANGLFAYEPGEGEQKVTLDKIPFGGEADSGAQRFASFLQVASFMIRVGEQPLDYGLYQFLNEFKDDANELEISPWMKSLFSGIDARGLREIISKRRTFDGDCPSYFWRLMKWADSVFQSRADLNIFEKEPGGSAFHLWELLGTVTADAGFQPFDSADQRSSVPARLACGLYWALHQSCVDHKIDGTRKRLLSEDNRQEWFINGRGPSKVIIPAHHRSIDQSREHFKINDTNEYSRTSNV